jgi:2-polyprenyl-3-methyl-5-hydroxy-6-metoxy-1,4-benzoquinol methylase
MRMLDRVLQKWRARMARPFILSGAKVLDVGCHQGEFLSSLGEHIGPSIGVDPLASPTEGPRYRILSESFLEPMSFPDGSFDVVVMLATLEHIRDKDPLGRECFRLLRSGGRLIITVPSLWVDGIVGLLHSLRLVSGMSFEEHHGFDPRTTPELFLRHGFTQERWQRFQVGLNNLFVFRKPSPKAQKEPEA